MDPLKKMLEDSLALKAARRRQLAALPFEEKVRIVVKLQQMQAPILRARGIDAKVWKLKDR